MSVRYRIEEHLKLDLWAKTRLGKQRDHDSHISTRAITSYGKARRIDPNRGTLLSDPLCRSIRHLDSNRIVSFGRPCKVDEDDGNLCSCGNLADQTVVSLVIT